MSIRPEDIQYRLIGSRDPESKIAVLFQDRLVAEIRQADGGVILGYGRYVTSANKQWREHEKEFPSVDEAKTHAEANMLEIANINGKCHDGVRWVAPCIEWGGFKQSVGHAQRSAWDQFWESVFDMASRRVTDRGAQGDGETVEDR